MLINGKIEIAFLQETHLTPEASKKWKKEWLGKSIWHSGTTPKASGVAILFKENLDITKTIKTLNCQIIPTTISRVCLSQSRSVSKPQKGQVSGN